MPTWLRWTLLALAWPAALACAAYGWVSLGGYESSRLDLLTHLEPLALVGALAALASWWGAGKKGSALPVLCVIALVPPLGLMGPEMLRAVPLRLPAPAKAERLKVLQFNLWSGNTQPQAAAAYILKTDADIVLLQEAQGAAVEIVEAVQARYPHSVSCYWGYHCDIRILMKRPPLTKSRENPGPKGTENTDIGQVAWARTTTPRGVPFTAVSLHFGWPPPLGSQRFERTKFMRELVTLPREGLIVAGDFNSAPWSFAMHRQDRDFGMMRRTRSLPTWPGRFPVLPLDHLYAAPEWRTVSVRRGPQLGSDHRPVVTTLAYVPKRN